MTAASVGGSSVSWSNPNNALTLDNNVASVVVTTANDESHSLRVTGFGFAVPANASIRGVTAVITRRQLGADTRDENVVLIVNNQAVGQSRDTNSALPSSLQPKTYGGGSDVWGVANLTPAIINSPLFGLGFRVKNHDVVNGTAEVDEIKIDVAYCE